MIREKLSQKWNERNYVYQNFHHFFCLFYFIFLMDNNAYRRDFNEHALKLSS